MKQPTNDYRVFEDVTHTGEVRWIIRAGGAGGVMISTYVIAADILAARKS